MTPERWGQLEELYQAARALPPSERTALLERADPELRATVSAILAEEGVRQKGDAPREDGAFLNRPAWEGRESLLKQDGTLPTETSVSVGEQLGPYRLEQEIGHGGMGTVYRATDTRLGRPVAIKISKSLFGERSEREARAISSLNHPHICTLHDVGPNYLVMEFIEGSTLATEIKKGPLTPAMAARYGAQIAGALAEAHLLGIVHRDLKPPNLMLARHGVKVLDFGLAKMLATTGITETDVVMGTPAYMAPEQVESQEPTAATDLFSLGLVLFEMSVGRLPFPGASLGQMLSSGAQTTVPAPSRECSGVPPALDALVSKLLEKDPARRPQSAAEVARELSSIADRLAAPPARSPFRDAFVAIPAVALMLGLAAWFYLRSREPASQSPIALPTLS